ncbi:hypothetical protein EI94DRAFT_1704234 [Lactarius quietus]|nr:hypothetical protein EI94DRAFT_1704234 [Lactarius quietus]
MAPKVMKCPDGHFHQIVIGLGPYIADYPEQVWLSGIVSNWCAKWDALLTDLDGPGSHQHSHEKTKLLIDAYDSKVLWDDFDLLHQLIKGVFKDHLIKWILQYLHVEHREKVALEIIEDIDCWISSVPLFPGLHWFAEGCNFKQWMGDNSKALMKLCACSKHPIKLGILTIAFEVILSAIAGHITTCALSFWNLGFP